MTDLRRAVSAVFRYFPDVRGDIRMIHNGMNRIEVDETVEALWFAIDNNASVDALYQTFLVIIGASSNQQAKTTFDAILRHFAEAGFIEIDPEAA